MRQPFSIVLFVHRRWQRAIDAIAVRIAVWSGLRTEAARERELLEAIDDRDRQIDALHSRIDELNQQSYRETFEIQKLQDQVTLLTEHNGQMAEIIERDRKRVEAEIAMHVRRSEEFRSPLPLHLRLFDSSQQEKPR